jgi:type VI protein secretion system component VasF
MTPRDDRVRFLRRDDGSLAPPDFTPSPAPPPPSCQARIWAAMPWWFRTLLFSAYAVGLYQLGFGLLGRHSTLLFVVGLLCLPAAAYAAFRAGQTIIEGLRK